MPGFSQGTGRGSLCRWMMDNMQETFPQCDTEFISCFTILTQVFVPFRFLYHMEFPREFTG
ncbi:hypothetical protein E2C01_094006 [Portunus trituberculatus]|uniref:Uncharacterized protein n=1 Tax=Portunus trituberculatus TaxID=210409 RepID=A0A5B7JPA6_PORTR|nr:hypothetical protein [Portunus trituberculatus]